MEQEDLVGTWFQWIADVDATGDESPSLAAAITARLVERQIICPDAVAGAAFGELGYEYGDRWADALLEPDTWTPDGVRVIAAREVFWGGQGEYEWAECPRCEHRIGPGAYELLDGVEAWLRAEPATSECPACRAAVELDQWRWEEDYFAFASLGLWFWDWPALGPLVPRSCATSSATTGSSTGAESSEPARGHDPPCDATVGLPDLRLAA